MSFFSKKEVVKLSISSTYAHHWTAVEGVRELLANWMDELVRHAQAKNAEGRHVKVERKDGAHTLEWHASLRCRHLPTTKLGHVVYDTKTRRLDIFNVDTTIDRSALLLGKTTKRKSKVSGECLHAL